MEEEINQNQIPPASDQIINSTNEQPFDSRNNAPKKKSIIKRFLLWILGAVLFLVVLYFALPYIVNSIGNKNDPPFDDSDLLLNKIEVAQEDNSFYELIKLGKLLQIPSDVKTNELIKDYDWNSAEVEELLEKNHEALEIFYSAANKPIFLHALSADPEKSFSNYPSDEMDDSYFNYGSWLRTSDLNYLKALFLMKVGREEEAFEEVFNSLKVADQIEKSENVIILNYISARNIKNKGLDTLRLLIDRTSLPQERLSYYQEGIKSYPSAMNNDLFKMDYLKYKYSYVESLNSAFENNNKLRKLADPSLTSFYHKPNQTLAIVGNNTRDKIKFFESECSEYFPRQGEPYINNINPLKIYFTENIVGKLLADISYERFENLKYRRCEYDMKLKMIDYLFAIKRYRIVEGSYPPEPSSLLTEYITQLPLNSLNNSAIVYDPEKKIIYSSVDGHANRFIKSEDLVFPFDFSVTESREVENSGFVFIDSDNDGLYDFEELWHGTDIYNDDTDNDGFKDGAEVAGGYNPLGAGRLPKSWKTPEGSLLFLEEYLSDCAIEYYQSRLYFHEDTFGYVKSLENNNELAEKSDQEIGEIIKNDFTEKTVPIYKIDRIEILKKNYFDSDKVALVYRINYDETEEGGGEPLIKEILLILIDGEWYVDIFAMIKKEFDLQQEPEHQRLLARNMKRVSDVKQIQTALELYYNEKNVYPEKLTAGEAIDLEGFYLLEFPKNPDSTTEICPAKTDYEYKSLNGGKDYEIRFCLEVKAGAIPIGWNIATSEGMFQTKMKNCE